MATTTVESLAVYLLLLFGALFLLIGTLRARFIRLRDLPAYDLLPSVLGEAVESGKAIHVSFGGSAVGEEGTLSALASAELLYHVAEGVAIGDSPTLVTLSNPVTLTLAQDSLRQAHKTRGVLAKYRPLRVQWYPQGQSSMTFAAGAGLSTVDDPIATNILVGRLGAELSLLAENSQRNNQRIIAQSDQIEGQAIAYALSPTPLIGEELYAAGAYLDKSRVMLGSVAATDVLRLIVVVVIFLAALAAFVHGG